jgi:hypothetical protein
MPHSLGNHFSRFAALAAVVAMLSCDRQPTTNEIAAVEPALPEPVANQDVALGDFPLDRSSLLITLLGAASAATIGANDAEVQKPLEGRRFDLKMRFGCPGGQPSQTRNFTFDEATGALKVIVQPDIDEDVERDPDVAKRTGTNPSESAKTHRSGFLIPSPMQLQPGCPTGDFAAAAGFSNLRFGLVQTTDEEAPRARQLLDSYEIVKKIALEARPKEGLDLNLRGRLESSSGKTISCVPKGGFIECLAAVTIDHVSITDPANGRLIAEWGAN